MTENKDEDVIVEYSDQVKNRMADDPELAEAIRDFAAILRQASEGVKRGQYKTMDDAIEVLTGSRPQIVIDLSETEDNGEN